MSVSTTTHLNLPGTAREALTFYRGVFGGEVEITTYAQVGVPQDAPGADHVVFGRLSAPSGFSLMAYDIPGRDEPLPGRTERRDGMTLTEQPFFISARVDSFDEAQRYWDGLAEEASVIEPLAASAWSAGFGMLTDRYGVTWSVDVVGAPATT